MTAPPNDAFDSPAYLLAQGFANATPVGERISYAYDPDPATSSPRDLYVFTGDNIGATAEASEPGTAPPPRHSVWWSWMAPYDSTVRVQESTFDPNDSTPYESVLRVYTGDSLADLDLVGQARTSNGATALSFTAVAGTYYSVSIDSADEGLIHGRLDFLPTGCTVTGTSGADTLTGSPGPDVICGYGGPDKISGGGGDDILIGGPGIDTVNYSAAPQSVAVDLYHGLASGQGADSIVDMENVTGSPYNDSIEGDGNSYDPTGTGNRLVGNAGNDTIHGVGGDDTVIGGPGNDTLGLGDGDDHADGGGGQDTAFFAASSTAVLVNLASGVSYGQGSDTLTSIENVIGTHFNDNLTGSSVANVLNGLPGNDTLTGGEGDDTLEGFVGNDSLTGDAGDDSCDGGKGSDTATTCETTVSIP